MDFVSLIDVMSSNELTVENEGVPVIRRRLDGGLLVSVFGLFMIAVGKVYQFRAWSLGKVREVGFSLYGHVVSYFRLSVMTNLFSEII